MSEELRGWIIQELKQRGWSYNELARRTGFTSAFMSKALTGKRTLSVNFCHKVAEVLDVTPEYVFRLAGILPPASLDDDSILQELIELARNLPPEDKEELLTYARFRYQNRQK